MEVLVVIGYLIGFLIGAIMGVIGGGGALILPTMVYLLERETTLATAYTLILVGVTALIGMMPRLKSKEIDFPTVLALGIPVLLGTLLVRGYLTHEIPDFVHIDEVPTDQPLVLFSLFGLEFTKRMVVLMVFATVLLFSFASMIGLIGKDIKPRPNMRKNNPKLYYSLVIGAGLFIGVLSAFVGAGGGVMIVPFLVIVMGLSMRTVVGTSLAIMAGKSIIGFSGDVYNIGGKIEWGFLCTFGAMMIAGIIFGSWCSKYVSAPRLKKGFAWLILVMAILIFGVELGLIPTPEKLPEPLQK